MNALKQRWESGFFGMMVAVGVLVFACAGCGATDMTQQGVTDQEPNTGSEVQSTMAPEVTVAPPTDTPRAIAAVASPTNTPEPTSTPKPPTATATAIPTETSTPTEIPTATSTLRPVASPASVATVAAPAPSADGFLPGLTPDEIKNRLQERGFACPEPTTAMSQYVWRCQTTTDWAALEVIFYSRTPETVDFLDASAMHIGEPRDDLAADFLGFVATLPYDNAEPDAARAWVVETLPTLQGAGDVREATFGGVPFTLFDVSTARVIEFGVMTGF